jgi:uncharacterized protein (DUF433 family)
MRCPERIESKNSVMMGKPCVKGTRIPVYLLLEKMAAGESFDNCSEPFLNLQSTTCAPAWIRGRAGR